jgi:glycosyltransferase involved in cell wall biosynthesis
MKIGLFSDSYHPSTNGIVVVIDVLQANLVKLGHEVVVIAPRPGLRSKKSINLPGKNVLWIPAIEGLFFDEYLTSVFSPTRTVKKIEAENLDAVIIFTPAQVGLLGAYIAKKNGIPLVEQYSTDLAGYINQYPSTIAGMFALSLSAPFALKLKLKDIASISRAILSFKKSPSKSWSSKTVTKILTIMHNNTDFVIALSEKLYRQMKIEGVTTKMKVIPTGVNALPSDQFKSDLFRKKLGLSKEDKVILYAGRLGPEKNLDLLLDSFIAIAPRSPFYKLVFVGDFKYRAALEEKAAQSGYEKQIVFAGRLPRNQLGYAYEAADIFAFPSLTDTQGLVLNEAAHAGLPIVWCDELVNGVVKDKLNGVLTKENTASISAGLLKLLSNESLRKKYGKKSQLLAKNYSEEKMTKELVNVLKLL